MPETARQVAVTGLRPCAIPDAWVLAEWESRGDEKSGRAGHLAGTGRDWGSGEFRVLREGEAWRLELRLGVKWLPVRSRREPVRL